MLKNCVHIKPLKREQAATSYSWRNDPEVWKFTGKRPDRVINQEIEEEWIDNILLQTESKRFGIWMGERYIGNIQLTNIIEGLTGEYHIFIGDRNFWGRGVAKLATFQILRFARNTLFLKEVYLKVNSNHVAAIHLYKTCGFEEESEENGWKRMKVDLSIDTIIPKLSIFIMTFNHGAFLSQALEGILKQQCDFDFEIVVGDDCSTDNTREILLRYNEDFPGRFRLILHEKNIGAYQNQNAVFKACKGEYIAICEGDDYWDDPNKLQKQVDFLEAHSEYVISFHEVEKIDLSGKPLDQFVLGKERWKDLDRERLIAGDLVPSVSAVFRGKHLREFINLQVQVKNGDTFLFAILGQYGKAHFHADIQPAKYRIHGGGVWSGVDLKRRIEGQIHTFEILSNVVLPINRRIVKQSLFERYLTQLTRFDYSKKEKFNMYFKLWGFIIKNQLLGKMIGAHLTALKNKLKF